MTPIIIVQPDQELDRENPDQVDPDPVELEEGFAAEFLELLIGVNENAEYRIMVLIGVLCHNMSNNDRQIILDYLNSEYPNWTVA